MDRSWRIRETTTPPVLSTVLLVAITIGLCVIIGVGVVSMADQTNEAKIVGLLVSRGESGSLSVTIHAGEDARELVLLEVLDAEAGTYRPVLNQTGAVPSLYGIGEAYTAFGVVPAGTQVPYTTRILVRGTFLDEYQVVLLDERVTFSSVSQPVPTYQRVEHIVVKA